MTLKLAVAGAFAIGLASPATGQPQSASGTKTVRVLATGGTIAGSGQGSGAAYKAGVVPIDDILRSVPGLANIANVTSEQVANVGSNDIDEALWLKLLSRVQAAILDPTVSGVIITHGTDTLEESAFLLSLVLSPAKPVVFVGSMRAGTTVGADGPQNLLDAARVAVSDDARNRGVLIVLNDTIFDPVEPAEYGTHSLRRTKVSMLYRKTGNLRACQLLLGHTKLESTVRYLGVELDDALALSEALEI